MSITLKIEGMMCQMSCGTTVGNALRGVEGVEKAEASFEKANATVWFSTKKVLVNDLIEAAEAMGFGAELDEDINYPQIVLTVSGMKCQKNCASKVQKALLEMPGVYHAVVKKADARATIWHMNQDVSISSLVNTIENLGFTAELDIDRSIPDAMLHIEGMMCQMSCGTTVTNALNAVPGVFRAQATFDSADAKIWGENLKHEALIDAVESMGFGAARKEVQRNNTSSSSASSPTSPTSPSSNGGKSKKTSAEKLAKAAQIKAAQLEKEAKAIQERLKAESQLASLSAVKKFQVSGISCAVCCGKIEKHLNNINGVKLASVNPVTHVCSVGFYPPTKNQDSNSFQMKPPSSLKLIDEIVSLGYGAREIEVGGKSDNALDRLNSTEELDEWRRLFLISVAFTLPLFILQYFFLSLTDTHDIIGGITLKEVLMLFIATPMQMIVGRRFYKAAYLGYQHGVVGMDFLISLGVGGSYLNSCVVVFLQFLDPMFDKPVMFETAGMLLSFVTLGKFLEKTATGHTTAALARLAGMQPQKAIRVALDSKGLPVMNGTGEATVDVCDVQLGDCIKVLPGGAIPVDGVVLRGESYVDESMISGEPLPVAKKNKDNVFGGTINQLSILYIVANRVGEETALAQIVRLVEEAQTSKAPIQAFADRIAAIFAPMIILLSMMTFIFWIVMISGQFANPSWFEGDGSMQHMEPDELPGAFLFAFMSAIAVLVVACPCALGLATPTAVMVGTGVGAKHGVLIKGGDVLEAATKVDCIIFDKTGTLTSGKLSLSDEVHIDEACSRAANLIMGNGSKSSSSSVPLASIPLLLAASVEQASEHPIGKALTNAASANGLSTLPLRSDAKTDVLVGSGVVAALQLKKSGQSLTAAVGNVKLMKDQNISVSSDITAKVKALEEQGKTVVLVAVMNNNDKAATNGGGYAVGALALTDQLKPSANNTVRNLERNGIEVWMITGDAEAPARYTATQAGIDPNRVIAKALPETKALEVKRLQGQGKMVALIGDGINDSPALAQADVGIAIGAGTQVALEAANMVLIRDDLHGVSIALDLAKTVFFRIKLNYVWALGYNLFGVPTAAGVVMPFIHGFHLRPEIAAACMAFSSIAVVLSSLSLNLYKPPQSGVNWIEDDGVMSVIKNVISWSVDSIINQNKKGHYTRVNDFDEEEDENDEEMGGSGQENLQVSRRSNASGGVNYGATIVPHEPNPFTD